MFVRSERRAQLVASETSCRCARDESSKAASIVLNVEASRESSSRPVTSIRREVARLGHVLRRPRGGAPAPARRATTRPSSGSDDAEGGDQQQPVADPRQRVVDLVERARDLERVAVLERQREHADVPATCASEKNGPSLPSAAWRSRSPTGSSTSSPSGRIVVPVDVTSRVAGARRAGGGGRRETVVPSGDPGRSGAGWSPPVPAGLVDLAAQLVRTSTYVKADATTTAAATASALIRTSRVLNVMFAQRVADAADRLDQPRPPALLRLAAQVADRRRASSSRSRSRSPRPARRSATG